MRESIGASWMLGIVVVFVFLFLFFLTYSINYTRAFNVKNEIINYIEHAEGYTDIGGKSHGVVVSIDSVDITSNEYKDTVRVKAYNLIKNTGYQFNAINDADCHRMDPKATRYDDGGYCIVKVCQDENPAKNTYYKITTFIAMKIPFLNISINIPVNGQTRTIYQDNSNYPCDY